MSQHEKTNNASRHRELLEATNAAGFFQLLGVRIEATDIGKGKVSINVDERLMHPLMIVHGGVTFTLADTAMSMAILSLYPVGTRVSTIEAKINYLLPVCAGELIAEANVVQQGRLVAVTEATVYNINEGTSQAIARILGTFSIRQPKVE